LIDAQVAAGYTSFAIDASHSSTSKEKNVREELEKNIVATTDLAHHIKNRMKGKDFGLEVEVGEIGRKDGQGLILTKPEEAVRIHQSPAGERGISPGYCHCQREYARACV